MTASQPATVRATASGSRTSPGTTSRPGRGASFRLTLPRRAGIRLTASPLELVPDEPPTTGAVQVVTRSRTDPAALPDLVDEQPADTHQRQEVR